VFQGFGQAKFADAGLIFFWLEAIYTTVPAAPKLNIRFKSGQN